MKLGIPSVNTPSRVFVYNWKNGVSRQKSLRAKKKESKINFSMKLFGKLSKKSRSPIIWINGKYGSVVKLSNCDCTLIHCEYELLRIFLEHWINQQIQLLFQILYPYDFFFFDFLFISIKEFYSLPENLFKPFLTQIYYISHVHLMFVILHL